MLSCKIKVDSQHLVDKTLNEAGGPMPATFTMLGISVRDFGKNYNIYQAKCISPPLDSKAQSNTLSYTEYCVK